MLIVLGVFILLWGISAIIGVHQYGSWAAYWQSLDSKTDKAVVKGVDAKMSNNGSISEDNSDGAEETAEEYLKNSDYITQNYKTDNISEVFDKEKKTAKNSNGTYTFSIDLESKDGSGMQYEKVDVSSDGKHVLE